MNAYHHLTPIERFAAYIIGKPLYPYQAQVANAILRSIEYHLSQIITVMMLRQSGKNQLSAIIEAFLLFSRREGTIIKAAPTFSPQILTSRCRLMQMLDNPFLQTAHMDQLRPDRPRPHQGLASHSLPQRPLNDVLLRRSR